MRPFILALALAVTGCATTTRNTAELTAPTRVEASELDRYHCDGGTLVAQRGSRFFGKADARCEH